MAKIIKKKCVLCKEEYEIYCPTCAEASNQPTWKQTFHELNCRDIYNACSGFYAKAYTADEAKVLLDLCDLSNKESFTPSTIRLIDEIYSSATVVKEVRTEKSKNMFKNKSKK